MRWFLWSPRCRCWWWCVVYASIWLAPSLAVGGHWTSQTALASLTTLNRLVYYVTTMSLLCHYYVTNKYKRNKPTFVCHHIERWGQKSYQNFFKFAFLRLSPCLSYTWIVETVKYFVFHSKMNHFIRNIAGILRFLLYTKFECIMISILSTEFMECKNLIHFSISIPENTELYISKKMYIL